MNRDDLFEDPRPHPESDRAAYERLIGENYDLREELSKLRNEIHNLNHFRIVVNVDASPATQKLSGKTQSLAHGQSSPQMSYEECEGLINHLEGMIQGYYEILRTKDKLPRDIKDREIIKTIQEKRDLPQAQPSKVVKTRLTPQEKTIQSLMKLGYSQEQAEGMVQATINKGQPE